MILKSLDVLECNIFLLHIDLTMILISLDIIFPHWTLTYDLDKLGYHISPISIALSTISRSLIIHIFYIKHRTTYDLDNLGYYNSNCPTYDLDEFGYGYPISHVIPEVLDLSHPWLLLQLRVYPCYIGMQLILQK